jgi:hypothetical protein
MQNISKDLFKKIIDYLDNPYHMQNVCRNWRRLSNIYWESMLKRPDIDARCQIICNILFKPVSVVIKFFNRLPSKLYAKYIYKRGDMRLINYYGYSLPTIPDLWKQICYSGNLGIVRHYAEVVKYYGQINQGLFVACRQGHLNIVKYLYKLQPKIRRCVQVKGQCIKPAIIFGHNSIVDFILSVNKHSINTLDFYIEPNVIYNCGNNPGVLKKVLKTFNQKIKIEPYFLVKFSYQSFIVLFGSNIIQYDIADLINECCDIDDCRYLEYIINNIPPENPNGIIFKLTKSRHFHLIDTMFKLGKYVDNIHLRNIITSVSKNKQKILPIFISYIHIKNVRSACQTILKDYNFVFEIQRAINLNS